MKQTILLVSEDQETARIWATGLSHRGLDVIVPQMSLAVDEALKQANHVDLVIIDTYERNMNGVELLYQIRSAIDKPILLFTYEHDERYHLDAYAAGVEECVPKPIGIPLFLCKVQVWLRRSQSVRTETPQSHSTDFQLNDMRRKLITPDGSTLQLSNLECRLARLFLSNRGRILETDLIIERVWIDYDEGDQTLLKNLVYRLRQKLEPNPSSPQYIQTVPGVGYVFQME